MDYREEVLGELYDAKSIALSNGDRKTADEILAIMQRIEFELHKEEVYRTMGYKQTKLVDIVKKR